MNPTASNPTPTPPPPQSAGTVQYAGPSPREVVGVIGRLFVGLCLIALGAATVFSFLRQLQTSESATQLEWSISFGMVGLFGLLPVIVGVVIVFRAIPTQKPENSNAK